MNKNVALVTGGGQGIGKATVRRLLEAGYSVVIGEIDAEAGAETAEEYAALGAVRFIALDVADDSQVQTAMKEATAVFGGVDVLVNNAAIAINRPLEQLDPEQWRRVIDVNLTGPLLCAKHAAPHLRRRRGAIINIASTRAMMSQADTEAYSASKGGLLALTHALALSLGPEIRVNSISPGWIDVTAWRKHSAPRPEPLHEEDHRQHPAGRVGRPQDVAELVLFLARADTAGFITGQNFIVDGGMTRKMIYV